MHAAPASSLGKTAPPGAAAAASIPSRKSSFVSRRLLPSECRPTFVFLGNQPAVFCVERYPTLVAALLTAPHEEALDAGTPDPAVRAQLAALRPHDLSAGKRPVDLAMAQACLAGLWLRHNYLDESHHLSQEIETPTGSYWHAVMHRREADYDNAKYWLRRAGDHPAMTTLQTAARAELTESDTKATAAPVELQKLLDAKSWDPYRFVDLCAAACRGRSDLVPACRQVQRLEWETLFDFCFVHAVGER